jgi:hypothetical protein
MSFVGGRKVYKFFQVSRLGLDNSILFFIWFIIKVLSMSEAENSSKKTRPLIRTVIPGITDMATTHPVLAKELVGDPTKVVAGTAKKLEWRCGKGHQWMASGDSRVNRRSGCPFCAGVSTLAGFNDLATTHPELAKEIVGDPTKVKAGTNKKLFWRCEKGHEWKAPGSDRLAGNGCPFCSNKRVLTGFNDLATTHPELAKELVGDPTKVCAGTAKKLHWKCINGHEWLAVGFSRGNGKSGCPICSNQKVLPGFNDLATSHPNLALECLDDPKSFVAGTMRKIRWRCDIGHEYLATGASRTNRKTGCPICANLKVLAGFNDLATTHPDLAREMVGDPTKILATTEKKIKWRCVVGHEWFANGRSRSVLKAGCPVCAGQKVSSGHNDMATTHPHLAAQLIGDPEKVIAGTNKKLKWRCSKGHEYFAFGCHRVAGSGCPICANLKVLPGFNDLATTHPELAKELVGDPTKIVAGNEDKVRWRCSKGHEWKAVTSSRTAGRGCPFCCNYMVWPGFNDMATTHPELAKELIGDPTKFLAGTDKKLRWRCEKGHEWKATGSNRRFGYGCPRCSKYGHDQTKDSYLYLVGRPGQFKIGIMNFDTKRLEMHSQNGWTLIDAVMMAGDMAREIETKIKKILKKKRIPMGPKAFREKFDGWYEAWQVVDLDIKDLEDLLEKLGTDFETILES